jgi:hypothetical protein
MMDKSIDSPKSKIEEARNSLIQGAMKEINESINSPHLYTRVFCVIAKFGLQQEAREEGIITYEEEPTFQIENTKEYLHKINQFLVKYIR